jgi:hypothetical protein
MSSTYSTNLRTELIGSGDQSGTWGNTTNGTLGSILEQAIAGVSGGPYIGGTYPVVNFPTDADITLTANNGAVDQSRSAVLVVTSTGSLTATRNVIAPASASKVYIIKNSTTGGQSIQIKYSTGTGVTIANGLTAVVYGDGTNFNIAVNVNSITGNLAVSGNTTIGGTLAVTGAQTNSSTITATNFIGPGTGLTGTAGGLSIGGNAATATNATNATNAINATNVTSGGTIASNVTATTQSSSTNNTTVATTAYVKSQKYGLGITGETWRSPSRSIGTTYTNSNAYPIMVNVGVSGSGNVSVDGSMQVNGVTVDNFSQFVGGNQGTSTSFTFSAIVPPAGTYSVSASNASLSFWSELY